MNIFKRNKPSKIYTFLSRLSRINKDNGVKFIVIGSGAALFSNQNVNPSDLDIVFRDEKDMYELISEENFREINKDERLKFNISTNEDLASQKKYVIKYFGFHIDIYAKEIYEIPTDFIFEHSKPIRLNEDDIIFIPIDEVSFILKAIKFENIEMKYSRRKNRALKNDLLVLIDLYKHIDGKLLIKLTNQLSYNVRLRTFNVIKLITDGNRDDINSLKDRSAILNQNNPKKSSFAEFIRRFENK